jgi:hypothetical protein
VKPSLLNLENWVKMSAGRRSLHPGSRSIDPGGGGIYVGGKGVYTGGKVIYPGSRGGNIEGQRRFNIASIPIRNVMRDSLQPPG